MIVALLGGVSRFRRSARRLPPLRNNLRLVLAKPKKLRTFTTTTTTTTTVTLPRHIVINKDMSSLWWQILAGFGGYVVVSVFALLFPLPCFRRKKLDGFPPTVHCSHRGGAYERHENTLAAYRHAVEACNTDLLEIDVRLTADGKVVIFHDNDLRRLTGQSGYLHEMHYSDLEPLLPSHELSVPYASITNNRTLAETMEQIEYTTERREKVCTLEEAFQEFPQICFNIDIKHDNIELIEKVHALIQQYNRQQITIWGSMNDSASKKIAKLDGDIPLFFSIRSVIFLFVKYFLGILPFWPIRESFVEIPFVSEKMEKRLKTRFGHTLKIRLIIWFGKHCLTRKTLFRHLQKRGVRVLFWVLNEVEDFETAQSLGVDGIMTDRPTLLREFLQINGKLENGEKDPLRG